jgi:hypothetical protein
MDFVLQLVACDDGSAVGFRQFDNVVKVAHESTEGWRDFTPAGTILTHGSKKRMRAARVYK